MSKPILIRTIAPVVRPNPGTQNQIKAMCDNPNNRNFVRYITVKV